MTWALSFEIDILWGLRFAKGLCVIIFDSISAGDLPVPAVLVL